MLLAAYATLAANNAVTTTNASGWIRDNVVQLVILVVAVIALAAAGRGDNAKIIRIIGGIAMAVAILALSTGGNAENIGAWLVGLIVTG